MNLLPFNPSTSTLDLETQFHFKVLQSQTVCVCVCVCVPVLADLSLRLPFGPPNSPLHRGCLRLSLCLSRLSNYRKKKPLPRFVLLSENIIIVVGFKCVVGLSL